jgi:hypothetical protein
LNRRNKGAQAENDDKRYGNSAKLTRTPIDPPWIAKQQKQQKGYLKNR